MICKYLSEENLKVRTVQQVIRNFKERGTHERKPGSGRTPISDTTQDLIESQEDNPGSHQSQRQIARITSVNQSMVSRILKKYKLKCYKRYVLTTFRLGRVSAVLSAVRHS